MKTATTSNLSRTQPPAQPASSYQLSISLDDIVLMDDFPSTASKIEFHVYLGSEFL